MSIVKLKRAENPFEILPRATLQDARLSLDALGALVRLASLPGDWEWQAWHLEKEVLKIGRDLRRRIFNELESAGYLNRSLERNSSGRWDHHYNLQLECSNRAAPTSDGFSVAGSTVAGQGGAIQNTELENTQLENTQQQQEPSVEGSDPAAQQGRGGGGCSLIFPSFLNAGVIQKIEDLARALDQLFAQQILDVLAARADVKNPIAFFKKLASAPASFDPTAGLKIAAERIKKKEVAAAKIASSELTPDVAAAAKGAAILAAAATRRPAK